MRYLLVLDLILAVAGYVCGAPPQAPPVSTCTGGACPIPATICSPAGCVVVQTVAPAAYYAAPAGTVCYTCPPRRGLLGRWRR